MITTQLTEFLLLTDYITSLMVALFPYQIHVLLSHPPPGSDLISNCCASSDIIAPPTAILLWSITPVISDTWSSKTNWDPFDLHHAASAYFKQQETDGSAGELSPPLACRRRRLIGRAPFLGSDKRVASSVLHKTIRNTLRYGSVPPALWHRRHF